MNRFQDNLTEADEDYALYHEDDMFSCAEEALYFQVSADIVRLERRDEDE